MAQNIAALLRVTFPCKEFMGFKVCSLTKVSVKILAIIGIPTFLPKFFYRMANTVTIDSHPETTFVDEYRTARMLVSDETRIRIGRYGSP